MSICYHKNGVASSHQSVGSWFSFYVLFSKNILMTLVGSQQSTCFCVKVNSCLEIFRFHVNCIHFRGAVFVHVGPT